MIEKEQEVMSHLMDIIDNIISGNTPQIVGNEPIEVSGNPSIDKLAGKLLLLREQYNNCYQFILELSQGKLYTTPPFGNSFATPYKQLQSELRHLTWQIQQISEGEYDQAVSYSGDFSNAINKMLVALRERQLLADLLKESNRTKDRLFSIIAHDLKNPFNTLVGMSELTLSELESGNMDTSKELAQIIHTAASNGYALLINLLEWSRLQSGRITVSPDVFDLRNIILGNIQLINPTALTKEITIHYPHPEEYPITSDSTILNTILRNLLSNAVKYTPLGGDIWISIENTPGGYRISIADNGVGMKETDIQNLFHIETIISTRGTCDEEGTGLGLILCKDFAHKIGGEIEVKSIHGSGTTFTVSIPNLTKITDK